jgi:hypothetical protein
VLEGESGRPLPVKPTSFTPSIPRELDGISGINVCSASSQDELSSAFLRIIYVFKAETSFDIRLRLIEFVLDALDPTMFDIFLESNLAELLSLGSEYLAAHHPQFSRMVTIFDSHCLNFITRNFIPFTRDLNSPPVTQFQKFISSTGCEHSCHLSRTLAAAEKFAIWMNSSERTVSSLKLILDEIFISDMERKPLELATEISQCLIIAPLITTLIRCITCFLGHSRAPFANPSTVDCLQRVSTKRIVALPCHDVSLHPTYEPLESVLQMVRLSLFASTAKSNEELLQLAVICTSTPPISGRRISSI